MRFSVSADEQQVGRAGHRSGPAELPGARGMPLPGQPMAGQPMAGQPMPGQPMAGQPQPGQPLPGWNFGQFAGPTPELPANDQDDPVTRPDLGCLDWGDADADDDTSERYIPPHVPPQPKLDPVARGAWTALFGGPGYLFFATTLEWNVPGWARLAAIIAFVAGFVILVSRLGDGPSRRDGPDQGAVV
jgi:hypothetical protein